MFKLKIKITALLLVFCLILNIGLTFGAEVEYNVGSVTVNITVTDVTDYTKPINILIPRQKLTVSNFNLADYGYTLVGLEAVEGVTYLHALVQLHRNLYGDAEVINNFMLNDKGDVKYFMGRSVSNAMYKNGKDIYNRPATTPLNEGDEIQICIYNERNSQAISSFSEALIENVKVGEVIDLQLYQHWGSPMSASPIVGAEICDENGVYITDDAGNIVKTDKTGNFNLSFSEPGTYTISAMPQVDYYMSDLGGQILVEWVPKTEIITTEIKTTTLKGRETIIHDPTDMNDDVTSLYLALTGDSSNAPIFEAVEGNLEGNYYILSEDYNPINYNLSLLSNGTAVVLNPGASITVTFDTNVSGPWKVAYAGQSLDDAEKKVSQHLDDMQPYNGNFPKSKVVNNLVVPEVSTHSGLIKTSSFELGTHTFTLTSSTENKGGILIDHLYYGENVTTFESKDFPVICTLVEWDDLFNQETGVSDKYDVILTPDDPDYIDRVVDKRPQGVNYPEIITYEDIVEEYIEYNTREETILEKIETVIPIELSPKLRYTTPLLVIQVDEGEMSIVNPHIEFSSNLAVVSFDTLGAKAITEPYGCYVATYTNDNKLVELKSVDTPLKPYSNMVSFFNLNFDYIKIFCWNNNLKPLCTAQIVMSNKDAVTFGNNTYITTPTVTE